MDEYKSTKIFIVCIEKFIEKVQKYFESDKQYLIFRYIFNQRSKYLRFEHGYFLLYQF